MEGEFEGENTRRIHPEVLEGRKQEAARIRRETLEAAYDTEPQKPPRPTYPSAPTAEPNPMHGNIPPELDVEIEDLVPKPESKRTLGMRHKIRELRVDLYMTGEQNFEKNGMAVRSENDFLEEGMEGDDDISLSLTQGDTSFAFSRNGVTITSGSGEDAISCSLAFDDLKGPDLRMVNASLKGASKLFLPPTE